ncbi:hypothetical protein EVAR_34427_1 [Eumeta japonica]|uniref:Uncharacterized protein n=1 Tax=Eumeta variegata TaxID=151549 RepID=A0A4C1WJW1_EUMVA|nr:hypothetical protein EVAR_34427_1 [Eumeta japonica]
MQILLSENNISGREFNNLALRGRRAGTCRCQELFFCQTSALRVHAVCWYRKTAALATHWPGMRASIESEITAAHDTRRPKRVIVALPAL